MIVLSQNSGFLPLSQVLRLDGKSPTKKFRKQIVTAGDFVKGDEKFTITKERMQGWADTFVRMKGNGIKVPIPSTHAKVSDSDFNRGWVTDMFVDDDSLVMTCELIGDDAIEAAARSDVSINAIPDFKDGKGVVYDDAITHVALCTDPVVPGLDKFIPIAASRSMEKVIMDYAKVGKVLGIKEDITEKNAEALILSRGAEVKKALDTAATTITSLKKDVEDAKKIPSNKKYEVSPVMLSLAAENRTMKLDTLVKDSKITPACCKLLTVALLGENNKVLSLSLEAGDTASFDAIIAALRENDPIELKSHTGPQVLKLQQDEKGNNINPLLADATARAKAAKAVA